MKEIFQTSQFKKDFKRANKRGKDLGKLKQVIKSIIDGQSLDERYRDHLLGGKWAGPRDCHTVPDWILIHRVDNDSLYLERTGTHSDLFRK
jgi:mRNA interferase YafQ